MNKCGNFKWLKFHLWGMCKKSEMGIQSLTIVNKTHDVQVNVHILAYILTLDKVIMPRVLFMIIFFFLLLSFTFSSLKV